MKKIFLLLVITIMLFAGTGMAIIIFPYHLCNTAAGKEMPRVTWDKLLFMAEDKSPVLEWTQTRC